MELNHLTVREKIQNILVLFDKQSFRSVFYFFFNLLDLKTLSGQMCIYFFNIFKKRNAVRFRYKHMLFVSNYNY